MIRARLAFVTTGVALVLSVGCQGRSAPMTTRKLVILGFSGLDPVLVERWIADGQLPNLAKLVTQGGFYRLETSYAPESAPAWASFATGTGAGTNNVYGMLTRDPRTYRPVLSTIRHVAPRFLFGYLPISKPRDLSTRAGTSFWVTAGQAGIRTSVLTVPGTYPPEEVPNGQLLSGLPLPDLRGTVGTYTYLATDLRQSEEGGTAFGGVLKRLVFEGDIARTELDGPVDPTVHEAIEDRPASPETDGDRARLAGLQGAEILRLPMTIHWNRHTPERSATIDLGDQDILLKPGEWSRWLHVEFRANLLVRYHGMVQLFLASAGDELRLYVSPINWDPARPPLPMSSPASLSGDLYERLGPYRTLGWSDATWALADGRIDDRTFLEDLYRAFDDRAQVILNRIDRHDWDLLVGVIGSTDRVQHMMWRLIDPAHPMYDPTLARTFGPAIARVYRRVDVFVGTVLEHLDAATTLLVVSDHGFHSWRRSVNLNTWLAQEGYLTLTGPDSTPLTLGDLFRGGALQERVNWAGTRAYAVGFGQIYLNVQGRESQGIVGAGDEYRALVDELRSRLMALTDPATGERIVRAVYTRDEIYHGDELASAPDLQVGFAEGYRVSWQTVLGGAAPGLVDDNRQRWSGDHGGFDYADTAGVLVSNVKIEGVPPRLVDIAPTVLSYFGVPVPSSLERRPLF